MSTSPERLSWAIAGIKSSEFLRSSRIAGEREMLTG
jgi:hypothetical protein